ncbi:MAG: UDP-N-acetylmuramate dehydrogenase [Minisyncoccia bacterium]
MTIPSIIKQNIPLASYTTLGVGGQAEYFCEVGTEAELREAVAWAHENNHMVTVLGGGSNVLVRDEGVKGLVLRVCILGVIYQTLDDESVYVTVGAGVILDKLIHELVEKKLWGLENLSAIPGTVGAVPIQNVGAYGVEAAEVIIKVTVYDRETGTVHELDCATCAFGYRDSLFKKEGGKRYIILSVTFKVSTIANPKLAYKDLREIFEEGEVPDIARVRNAVCHIRAQKFPDYTVIGTAGSFFKNPIIAQGEFERLCKDFPELPGFPHGEGMIKISLGWILDKVCNLKGYSEGEVGLYEKQALVLFCAKGIAADDVVSFSEKIIEKVFQKTNIRIEREVTIW